ncbi:UNVERIFIED_CONTAM: hypothetical protein FKN15_009266 [Acipenser sinensis]
MDLKAQMAQVLELLTKQQAPAASAAAPAPLSPTPVPAPVSLRGDQGEREASSQMTKEDALSIASSWGEDSFPTKMEEGEEPAFSAETEPSSKVASEASLPLLSSSMLALMGCAVTFLQVPWTAAAEQTQTQTRQRY